MIYQLPNGKIVNITVEQFLALTDDDFKYMNERNMGSICSDPFRSFDSPAEEEQEPIEYLDVPSDDDERAPIDTMNLDHIFDEE